MRDPGRSTRKGRGASRPLGCQRRLSKVWQRRGSRERGLKVPVKRAHQGCNGVPCSRGGECARQDRALTQYNQLQIYSVAPSTHGTNAHRLTCEARFLDGRFRQFEKTSWPLTQAMAEHWTRPTHRSGSAVPLDSPQGHYPVTRSFFFELPVFSRI